MSSDAPVQISRDDVVFPILHAGFCIVSNEDTLAMHYRNAIALDAIATKYHRYYHAIQKWDDSILPPDLRFSAVSKKIGIPATELGVFALGSPSKKRNQGTYLSYFEGFLNAKSGLNFLNLRSNPANYTAEVQKLLANGTIREFETHINNWYNGQRIGPSGRSQDIDVR